MHMLHIVVVGAHTSIDSNPPGIRASLQLLCSAPAFMPVNEEGSEVFVEELVGSPNWSPIFGAQV